MGWNLRLLTVAALALIASPSVAASDPYELHVILELTGSGAFIGDSEREAIELAEMVINRGGGVDGRQLHFVFHDNQSTPQVAVQLASDALATHPVVVLASTLVADCAAMAPLFQNGPVLYCFSPSFHPPAGAHTYSYGVSTRDLAIAGLRYFRMRGWTRLAIVTSTDATGQDAEKNLKDIVQFPENKDVKFVDSEKFNPTDVSVGAQMEQIRAAKPQALVAWSTGTPIATVFRGLQQAGIDIPVATTSGNEVRSQIEQYSAFLPDPLFFFTQPWPAVGDPRVTMDPASSAAQKEFEETFAERNVQPDQGSDSGWETVMVVVGALRRIGLGASAGRLQDYFQHLKGFASVSGVYDFERTPQRGLSVDNALVTVWNAKTRRFVAVSQFGGLPINK